ncbi:hypothetical protein TNCV_4912021 [Trichonephila clavipes]|nr:hypothetical protein TNCV_4912021 [Trichonephila clavipes]
MQTRVWCCRIVDSNSDTSDKRLMHVKSVRVQNPHVGVVVKLGEWGTISCAVLVTSLWFKIAKVLHIQSNNGKNLDLASSIIIQITEAQPIAYVESRGIVVLRLLFPVKREYIEDCFPLNVGVRRKV